MLHLWKCVASNKKCHLSNECWSRRCDQCLLAKLTCEIWIANSDSQQNHPYCRDLTSTTQNCFVSKVHVTWSRGMSRMSEILFLIYWQKQCSNSFVLYCFYHCQILHNSVTRYPIVMGFASKWSILRLWESGVRK